MTRWRAMWRVLRGLWHLLVGMWTLQLHFPWLSREQREMRVQAWALQLLALWGIHLKVLGQPVRSGPALMVCNHISWLDILVIHAARYCRFVSKSDIRGWPLVGMLATGAGTLYIERSRRKDALRMVRDMADALRDGDVLAVFPEGTTSDGLQLLPFHANLIQAAISANAPVLPTALRYVDARSGQTSQAVSFVGDESLVDSLWRTACASGLQVHVAWGQPELDAGRDRRTWAKDLQQQVHALWVGLGASPLGTETASHPKPPVKPWA